MPIRQLTNSSRAAAGLTALLLLAWSCPAAADPRPVGAAEGQSRETEDRGTEDQKAEAAEAAVPTEKVDERTLRWATSSELENFGFDVYRAESEDGPFTRITEKPIAGAGTTDERTQYEFVDDDVDPYKVYYYYVESISMNGYRSRFTPIRRSEAKLPRGGEEAEGEAATQPE